MVKGKYYTRTNENGNNFNVKQTWLKRLTLYFCFEHESRVYLKCTRSDAGEVQKTKSWVGLLNIFDKLILLEESEVTEEYQ